MIHARRRSMPRWLWGSIAASQLASPAAGGADFDSNLEVGAYADSDNVSVLTPAIGGSMKDAARGLQASGSYLVDIVSGASVDIVSTASPRWTEVRHAAELSVERKTGDLGVSVSGGASREPDFLAWSLGATGRVELDDRHVTPSVGYSFSHDSAGRSDTPLSVYSLELARHTVQVGVELILNRSSRLNLLAEAVFELGRQEKPYRFLPVFSEENAAALDSGASIETVNLLRLPGRMAERVPETRQRFSLTGDWATRLRASTLRVNERLYADSWGLAATTTDVSWAIDLGERWRVAPRARLHAQSGASFWRLGYVAATDAGQVGVPSLRSGDRELSPLVTGSLGLGSEYHTAPSPEQGWTFGALLDASHTRFFEALFIDRRFAGLVVLSVQRGF